MSDRELPMMLGAQKAKVRFLITSYDKETMKKIAEETVDADDVPATFLDSELQLVTFIYTDRIVNLHKIRALS